MDKNNNYFSQGVATEKFGIVFRSKLEAEWAYYFNNYNHDWIYEDKSFCDFSIGNGKVKIEIKPISYRFLETAFLKYIESDTEETLIIHCGSPRRFFAFKVDRGKKNDQIIFTGIHVTGFRLDYCWDKKTGFYCLDDCFRLKDIGILSGCEYFALDDFFAPIVNDIIECIYSIRDEKRFWGHRLKTTKTTIPTLNNAKTLT